MNLLLIIRITLISFPKRDSEIKLIIGTIPSVSSILRHISLSTNCKVPHGFCPILRRHYQVLVLFMYFRRAQVVELEVREAGAALIQASPFDISPSTNTAPQEYGTLQLVVVYVKDAGKFHPALNLLPLR